MDGILVTGGAGFIGCNFVRQWLAHQSTDLVNLDKLTYAGNLDSLADVARHPRYTFVQGDICDRPLVARLLRQYRPQGIVHFAAESHVDRSIDFPETFVETNVVGAFRLLEAARAYWAQLPLADQARFRYLHVSTDEVYGSLPVNPEGRQTGSHPTADAFAEHSPYRPNSPYAASKAAADHFARAYYHTYGLPVITTNCSNNYGPYQFPEKLIPLMILNALDGKPLPVYGDGGHVRDWLYVEDHCQAIRTVLAQGTPGEVYNIGGNCQRTNLEVVQTICTMVDHLRPGLPHAPCSRLITFVADRPGHDRRYAIDAHKIRTRLGWQPRQSFETAIRRTVQWYLDNQPWVRRVAAGTCHRERLGLNNAKTCPGRPRTAA
jgi:dTDP-glucose 4,6-dehydratase